MHQWRVPQLGGRTRQGGARVAPTRRQTVFIRAHGYSPALPSSIAPSSSSSSWPGLEPGSSPAWTPGPPPPSPMIGLWPSGLGGLSEPAPEDGLCSEFGRGEGLLRALVRRANPEPLRRLAEKVVERTLGTPDPRKIALVGVRTALPRVCAIRGLYDVDPVTIRALVAADSGGIPRTKSVVVDPTSTVPALALFEVDQRRRRGCQAWRSRRARRLRPPSPTSTPL